MRKPKTSWRRLSILLLALLSLGTAALAELPYTSYTYDYWQQEVAAPAAYAPVFTFSGDTAGRLSSPSDVVVSPQGEILLCDTGNNRIVVLTREGKCSAVIDSFTYRGEADAFSAPGGIALSPQGMLYVADSGNRRIVIMTRAGECTGIIEAPVDDTLPATFAFVPQKLSVDRAGRVYVVVKNVFEGMITFDAGGVYAGYFGTNRVSVGLADKFWRIFSTPEQRAKQMLYVPTEFTNLDIDGDGFVYTTDVDKESARSIKRFNPSSVDVLRNFNVTGENGEDRMDLIGDYQYPKRGIYAGRSSLVDVEYLGDGMYAVLDSTRGRVLTYDMEGNLLHAFGGIGTQLGMFKKPVSLESDGSRMYVLDQGRGELVVFEATRYGALIKAASALRYDGDETAAVPLWEEVLSLDANYRLAYIGIGKALLARNENAEAMTYLRKGMDKINYSVAFKRYRTDWLKERFLWIALALAVLAALAYLWYKRKNKGTSGLARYLALPRRLVFHPADGFYQMKYEHRGRLGFALLNVLLLFVSYSFLKQYTGFALNDTNPANLNILIDFVMVVAVYILWCTGNWLVTTLMDGEGSLRSIAMATGYALIPVNLIFIPATLVSNLLVYQEGAFFTIVLGIAVVWAVVLMFMGLLTVQNYTAGKTVLTVLLTVVAILIVVFLLGLVASLVQQMYVFFKSIYTEIVYQL